MINTSLPCRDGRRFRVPRTEMRYGSNQIDIIESKIPIPTLYHRIYPQYSTYALTQSKDRIADEAFQFFFSSADLRSPRSSNSKVAGPPISVYDLKSTSSQHAPPRLVNQIRADR
ncbi:hypothetical protein Trydic_g3838 [Trypoxylus dichotomus]